MTNIRVRLTGVRVRIVGAVADEPPTPMPAPVMPDKLPAGVVPVEYFEFGHERVFAIRLPAEEISELERIARDLKLNPIECIHPSKVRVWDREYELVIKESLVAKLPVKYQHLAKEKPPPTFGFYEVPVLYRFIPKEYAESLFAKGELMISSFERCRKDEGGCGDRHDKDEGKGTYTIQAGDCVAEFDIQVGGNPLMLCTSLNIDAKHNQGDACIEIFDLPAMINEITEGLRAKGLLVRRIQHGPCNYANRLFVRKCVRTVSSLAELMKGLMDGAFDFEMCAKMPLVEVGNKHYFTKPVNFATEHEYRIVWDCDNAPSDGRVIVPLKDPSAYCRYAS